MSNHRISSILAAATAPVVHTILTQPSETKEERKKRLKRERDRAYRARKKKHSVDDPISDSERAFLGMA